MTFEAVGTTIRVFDADGKPLATSVDSGTSLSSVVQVKVNGQQHVLRRHFSLGG